MNIEVLPIGAIEVNCYLVWTTGPDALVIDPGADGARIAGVLAEHGLSVARYLLTHGHVDHLSGLADLYDRYPAPIALHSADAQWAFSEKNELFPYYAAPRRPGADPLAVREGDRGSGAGLEYTVIETPGHTPGCVCYRFEAEHAIFVGDLLFAGSVGRTDLPGGDSRVMTASLRRLISLPDNTVVYPGHGPATRMGEEKRTNPFLGLLRSRGGQP